MAKTPKILLIYTGGTIGMVKDFETGALRTFDFDKLLKHIPELNHLNCNIENFSFEHPIDSSDMNVEEWVFLADIIERNYTAYDGFVILHGSDTMSYTASALSFMLENLEKPVILTGSQLPIGDLRTDAKENLITSIEIAACRKNDLPVISEVCLYFEYKLYRGNRTMKINAEHFQAFTSPNFPPLAESGVHLKFNQALLRKAGQPKPLKVHRSFDDRIAVLKLFPGITKEAVAGILNIAGLRGLVVESFGSGNATTKKWFLDLLEAGVKKGIRIVNVSQCAGGSVLMGKYEASIGLSEIGVISGNDITLESATAKLMYLLGENLTEEQFSAAFQSSLRGELSIED